MNAFHDLVGLDADECWELLASAPVARVGLQVGGRIDVLPVALEADGIDEAGRRGWSVLVHGTARIVTDEARQQQLFDAEVTPWVAPDQRTMWVEVAEPTISGRRVT